MRRHCSTSAFTLLEVLLALALSGVLIGVLAMAIRTQLKASDSGRLDVARAQLARAIMKRIGDDVRAAVWFEPIDPNAMIVAPKSSSLGGASSSTSSGPSVASTGSSGSSGSSTKSSGGGGGSSGGSSSGGGSSGGSSSSGGQTGSTSGASSTTTTTSTTTTSTTSSASTTSGSGGSGGSGGGGQSGGSGGGQSSGSGSSGTASTTITTTQNLAQAATMYATPTMPGLFGSSNWLQVDISRLPRPDEIVMTQGMQTTSQGSSQASDVKTVTYYMAGSSGMPQSGTATTGGSGKGLLRREISRATSVAATSGGGTSAAATASPEPLAPEVVNIELQYSNGSVYQSTWDSRQQYGLPKAVKIRVSFLADALEPPDNQAVSIIDQRKVVTYESVVAPAAWRPAPAWVSTMNSMNSTTGSNSSGMTGGTGAF